MIPCPNAYDILLQTIMDPTNKLDEWHQYTVWIRGLPYSEFITMEEEK